MRSFLPRSVRESSSKLEPTSDGIISNKQRQKHKQTTINKPLNNFAHCDNWPLSLVKFFPHGDKKQTNKQTNHKVRVP